MVMEHHSTGVRSYPIDVVRRLVAALQSDSVESSAAATTEPATVFTDVDRWHRERHQFFRRRPQVIGWEGELRKPNSFITRLAKAPSWKLIAFWMSSAKSKTIRV